MSVTSISATTGSQQSELSRRPIEVLIADHSLMDCQLLQNVFRRPRSPVRVVASAVSQAEIIRSMSSHCPDIALVSEGLQDGPLTGFGVLRELRNSFPKTKVIVLLKASREDLIVDAFRAGARGVFCRAEPLETLSKCIHAVHQGQVWANSSQLRSVMDAFASTAPLRIVNSRGRAVLTKREGDVVNLVIEGYTNRDVAEKLGLTEHTVSNYLFRIYEKLGVSSRVELVLYSLKQSC